MCTYFVEQLFEALICNSCNFMLNICKAIKKKITKYINWTKMECIEAFGFGFSKILADCFCYVKWLETIALIWPVNFNGTSLTQIGR